MRTLMLLGVLGWSAAVWAAPAEPAAVAEAGSAVVVSVEADDSGAVTKNVKVVRLDGGAAADAGGAAEVVVMPTVTSTGDGDKQVRIVTRVNSSADPNRGWLGVALAPTGADAAAAGVTVLNVVKDSPAEAAGLQKDDVITAINGAAVTGEVADLSRAIGEIKPGDQARISVLRDGTPVELTATLTAPKAGSIQWLHTPDMTLNQQFRFQPKGLMVTPQGNMQYFNIDELSGSDGLPTALAEMLNGGLTNMKISMQDGERVIEVTQNENGNVVTVRQEGEGPITVKRYTEGADDATEQEYADAAALEAADPDAFAIYDQQQNRMANVWTNDNGDTFTFNYNFDDDQLFQGNAEALQSAHDALMKAFGNQGAMAFGAHGGHGFGFLMGNKAVRSFKVTPDGAIEMTLRKGDSEIVKVFRSESDLQARDPEAFEKYQDVANAEIQE